MNQNSRNQDDDDDIDGGMSVREEDIRGVGPLLILVAFFLASLGLLIMTPSLTKAPPPNMGYHTHPAFFPTLILIVIVAGSGLVALRCLLRSWPLDFGAFVTGVWRHGKLPALFSAIYVVYFYAVALVGYMLATVVFVGVTLAISGVTKRQWLTGVIVLPAICFVVFVYFFEIWFPAPSLF